MVSILSPFSFIKEKKKKEKEIYIPSISEMKIQMILLVNFIYWDTTLISI